MSHDGEEMFVFAPLPKGASVPRRVVRLVPEARRLADGDEAGGGSGRAIRLRYRFGFGETHPVPLAALDEIVELPWRSGAIGPREVRALAPHAITAAKRACQRAARDLDELARTIDRAVDPKADDHDELRRFLGDSDALSDPADGDTDATRLAQIFAALLRGLRAAEDEGCGLLLIRTESAA
jgi:hypothetical protein